MQTPEEKIALMIEVAEKLYGATDTFEGDVGLQLAYLYPAIAKGNYVGWEDSEKVIIELFHSLFPIGHAIWQYIKISS